MQYGTQEGLETQSLWLPTLRCMQVPVKTLRLCWCPENCFAPTAIFRLDIGYMQVRGSLGGEVARKSVFFMKNRIL